jgi:hypothetical protein
LESYLERLWKFLRAISLWTDWISREVSLSEHISRFILDGRHMKGAKGWVSPAAFMPSTKTKVTSVYRTSRCDEGRIWLIGELFVERKRKDKRKILGRADIEITLVFQEGLGIQAHLLPHPRHADLTKWPDDKAQQKDKALALAQAAILSVRPGGPEAF